MERVWLDWWARGDERVHQKMSMLASLSVQSKALYNILLYWLIFFLTYIASWQPHPLPCDLFSLSLLPLTFTRLYVLSFGSLYFLNTFLTSADCPPQCFQKSLLIKYHLSVYMKDCTTKKRKILKSLVIKRRSGHRNEYSQGRGKQTG